VQLAVQDVLNRCHLQPAPTSQKFRVSLMQDIIEKAKTIDMDKPEAEIEEEANRLARRKYKILD
jgi:hypothetical protein